MEEGASAAPPLLNWDYLERCFARRRVCISFGLWICAACCWIAAHTLILYLRCTKKCSQDQSTLCAAFCLLTSLCDTVGAILARQLTIQVFTGAYLAAVDFMNFMFTLFPVCGYKSKSKSGQSSRERRRRHLRASVFALALPLSLGPGWAIWTAIPKAPTPVHGPQRRLLGSLLQENPEVFGYLLGAIAAFGSWASRIPPFSNICRGKSLSYIHLWTRFLSALAGLLYASAIVAHDRQPEYLLQATPWFLISLGRAALDLAVSAQAQWLERLGCLQPGALSYLPLGMPSFGLAGQHTDPAIQSLKAWDKQTPAVIRSSGLARFKDNSLAHSSLE